LEKEILRRCEKSISKLGFGSSLDLGFLVVALDDFKKFLDLFGLLGLFD
jgi:hypothetical protein